jgi:hypothetical protein
MQNDFNPTGGREDAGRERAPRPDEQRMLEREVPITKRGLAADVHSWLDGELSESELRAAGGAREVEFWSRIGLEAAQRRQVRTPPHVLPAIMQALPHDAPVASTWLHREITITPAKAIAIGAGLAAAASALTAALLRAR